MMRRHGSARRCGRVQPAVRCRLLPARVLHGGCSRSSVRRCTAASRLSGLPRDKVAHLRRHRAVRWLDTVCAAPVRPCALRGSFLDAAVRSACTDLSLDQQAGLPGARMASGGGASSNSAWARAGTREKLMKRDKALTQFYVPRELVQPTRFGNALLAGGQRVQHRWELDPIVVWPRIERGQAGRGAVGGAQVAGEWMSTRTARACRCGTGSMPRMRRARRACGRHRRQRAGRLRSPPW